MSARGTSQVSKIDKSTGVLLWTLGGKSNQFTFVDDPYGNLCGQHTASRLSNGNLLVFDNGQYCWPDDTVAKSQSSCGVEYFYLIVSEVKTLITLHGVFQEIPPTVNLPTLVGGAPICTVPFMQLPHGDHVSSSLP